MGRIYLFITIKMLKLYQELKLKYLFGFIMGFSIVQTSNSQIKENGLIKQEKIITYWNEDKDIIRSIGQYHTEGFSAVGEKIGKWVFYYPTGKVREVSHFFLGQLHGSYQSFYENGKLKFDGFFFLGKPDSTFKSYYGNGVLSEKGSYKVSPKINYYDTINLLFLKNKPSLYESRKINKWEYFYHNGKPMEKTLFKTGDTTELILQFFDTSGIALITNGKGTRKTYFADGKLRSLAEYKSGLKHGEFTLFKPNGQLRKTGFYKNGLMDSTWQETFIIIDTTYQITQFKDGLKSGKFKEFYPEGNISMKGEFKDNFKDGYWEYYFVNGKFDMKGGFKKDVQDGYWEYFYPSGQMYYEGAFVNGQKNKDWKFYYNDGKIWKEGSYQFDQKNGNWTTYFESGQKAMEGKFKNDKEDGIWKSWYENGQLKDKGYFSEGRMNYHWDGYYKNGQLKYSGDYENDHKNNKWSFWDPNGKLIEIRHYKVIDYKNEIVVGVPRVLKRSVHHGKWVKYDEVDGSVKSEENYADGKLNGVSKFYHPGGVITHRSINYKNGLLDGKSEFFGRKGNKIGETNYKENKKHGDMMLFSKKGKLIYHVIYKEGVKARDVIKKVSYKYFSSKNKK